MVAVSSGPIVVGGQPSEGDEPLGERVAFVGQVVVKVRGAVQAVCQSGSACVPGASETVGWHTHACVDMVS